MMEKISVWMRVWAFVYAHMCLWAHRPLWREDVTACVCACGRSVCVCVCVWQVCVCVCVGWGGCECPFGSVWHQKTKTKWSLGSQPKSMICCLQWEKSPFGITLPGRHKPLWRKHYIMLKNMLFLSVLQTCHISHKEYLCRHCEIYGFLIFVASLPRYEWWDSNSKRKW